MSGLRQLVLTWGWGPRHSFEALRTILNSLSDERLCGVPVLHRVVGPRGAVRYAFRQPISVSSDFTFRTAFLSIRLPVSAMSDAMSSAVSSVMGFLEEDSNDSSVQQDAAIADISADLELLRDDPRILKALRTGQDLTRYSRKVRSSACSS
jgi:hypothetical protein